MSPAVTRGLYMTWALGSEIPMESDRRKWPTLVRVGLWGIPNRLAAWACFWLSLAIAVGCVAYGFVNPRGLLGGLMVFAALWYYLSIRWVDRNGAWS